MNILIKNFAALKTTIAKAALAPQPLQIPNLTQLRMQSYKAGDLWKSVLSVSNQGAKKGRGRRRGAGGMKNLNVGQEIGEGKLKVEWPGLNAPVLKARQISEIKVVGVDEDREKRLTEIRNKMDKFRKLSIPVFERGWTGGTLNGKSIGEPAPFEDIDFKGFDTRVIEYKIVANMTSLAGKKRTPSAFVVTGNKNGIVGYGLGKASSASAALRLAKSNASKKLLHVDLFDNRTLFHNFYQEFYYTKIFAEKVPEGYGLRCHRIIKTICELVGIKDIYAKIEGSTNPMNVAKAFIYGLIKQKSFKEMAQEKKLHVVEFRPEMNNFPVVLASPEKVRTEQELLHDSENDFNLYILKNRYLLPQKKNTPFYANTEGYKRYLLVKNKKTTQQKSYVRRMLSLSDETIKQFQYPVRPKPKENTEEAAASE